MVAESKPNKFSNLTILSKMNLVELLKKWGDI